MREDQVYVTTKRWFASRDFLCVAGQPPRGCDNVPVVEIKSLENSSKGSFGAFKPDLVFLSSKILVVCECKPTFDANDINKLLEVDSSASRKAAFFRELRDRSIFKNAGLVSSYSLFEDFAKKLRYCVAYQGSGDFSEKVATLSLTLTSASFHEAKAVGYSIF